MEDIENRLQSHSAHFLSLYSLIPAQYVSRKCDDDDDDDKSVGKTSMKETRFWHNKKNNTSVKSRKINTQTQEKDETVSKHKKIDVTHSKSISLNDLQKRLQQKIKEVSNVRECVKEDGDKESQPRRRRKKRKRAEDKEGELNKKQMKVADKKKHRDNMKKNTEAKQRKVAVTLAAKSHQENNSKKDTPQLAFNKFEFNQSSKTTNAGGTKKKDYKQLIAKAELKHKKLQELIELDDEKANKVEERVKWSKAVRMAQGDKLKDDPVLLKKTVKRIEKRKQSHKKKWNERMKAEKQGQETRQKKRQHNIRERLDKIKAKKNRIRAKKRGLA